MSDKTKLSKNDVRAAKEAAREKKEEQKRQALYKKYHQPIKVESIEDAIKKLDDQLASQKINQEQHDKQVKHIKSCGCYVDQSTIDQANKEYLDCVAKSFKDLEAHKIGDGDFKKQMKLYRNDFQLVTHGKYYHQICQLHKKGDLNYALKGLNFDLYALKLEHNEELADINHEIKLFKSNPEFKKNRKDANYQNQLKALENKKVTAKEAYRNKYNDAVNKYAHKINLIAELSPVQKKAAIEKGKAIGWWEQAGKKWANIGYCALLVLFAILGLVDQIARFLITDASVGSFSIFTFITLIMLCLYVIGLIVRHMRRRSGLYDIVEAKHAKPTPSTGPIGTSSDSGDDLEYLEVLFEDKKPTPATNAKKSKK